MQWSWWGRWTHRRSDNDFAAEVGSHIAMETERLVRGGMSAGDAAFEARRAFGNPTVVREQLHDAHPAARFEWIAQDVRYGIRSMRRNPAFTAISVASLAIGIGANTTTFGAIDRLLLRTPSQVLDASRVRRVYFAVPGPGDDAKPFPQTGYGAYAALRDHVPALEAVGAFWRTTTSSGRGAEARPIDAVFVTPSVFTALGVRPALGRFFFPNEESDEQGHVAVIGYEAWRAWFGGNADALGRTIDVAGMPYLIVGIAPAGFTGIDPDRVDLWLPIGAAKAFMGSSILDVDPSISSYWLSIVAKLRDSVSVELAESQVTTAYRDFYRGQPRFAETFAKHYAVLGSVVEARGPAASDDAKVAEWVAAVSLLVLLIACANVANLLLLRGLSRSREIAVRLSLGASRGRLVRQGVVEGGLLVLLGSLCALLLARWTATAMQTFLLPKVPGSSVLDPRLLAFTGVIALGTGILASLVPAIVTARHNVAPLLGGGRAAGGPNRLRLQRMLIGAQVALATLLLVGAGLFVTSLRNVHAIDLGIDTDHLLYARLDVATRGKVRDSSASADALYRAMLERARRVPGVRSASLTAGEPLASGFGASIQRHGAPPIPEGTRVPFGRAVGADYFETMGTRLVRGRFFTAADHVSGAHVAIVDETLAKQQWPDGVLDPCASLDGRNECTQVVGVVANTVLWEMTGDKGSVVYVPMEDLPHKTSMMEIRTSGDPATLVPALRQAILSVSPNLPWIDIVPVSRRLDAQLRPWRLGASMFSAFGVLALCLAAVGLYGLLSYLVTQQSHEIGIRRALGATASGVVGLVLRRALAMTFAGVVIGIVIALGAGKLIATRLYGVSPRDPVVMSVCAAVLVIVAIAACLAPAHRATRIDPNDILRAE
jgi:predicted permease